VQKRSRLSIIGSAALALGAAVVVPTSTSASAAAVATTTVLAQPGGYITTYTAANGDVTKVFAATPMTIIPDAPTSAKITASGVSATQHSGGVSMVPTTALNKAQLSAQLAAIQPMSAYDELLALGADPADIAGFQDVGTTYSATETAKKKSGTASPYSNTGGGTQVSNPPACVDQSFDGGHGHVYGCDVTRRVATSGSIWYLTDAIESSGSMHDTGCTFCDHITGLKFGNKYGSGNVIQDWNPSSTASIGSCHQTTFSLAYKGVGVSDTATNCPETYGLYSINSTSYSTKWDGKGNGPSDGSRSTNAVDGVYNCGSCSYLPTVSATWWYTTS